MPFDPRRAASREAARKRRRLESDMFGDLSHLLPLRPSVRQSLDKPSVIRLTLSFIRARALLEGSVHVGASVAALGNVALYDGPGIQSRELLEERSTFVCAF